MDLRFVDPDGTQCSADSRGGFPDRDMEYWRWVNAPRPFLFVPDTAADDRRPIAACAGFMRRQLAAAVPFAVNLR